MKLKFKRLAAPDLMPEYIKVSWLNSYRKSRFAGVVPNNLYSVVYTEALRQLWLRGAELFMLVNADFEQQVVAWAVVERTSDGKPVVHYAMTKPNSRRKGYIRQLLAYAGVDHKQPFYYTFKTGASRYFPAGRYVPEIARRAVA